MRKRGKKLLSLILALLMIAGTLPILAIGVSAAEGPGAGMAFTQDKRFALQKNLSLGNYMTIQAEVWIDPSDSNTAPNGIIIGNYADQGEVPEKSYGLEMYDKGTVRFYTNDAGDYKFSYDIRKDTADGKFAKIAVTVDCVNFKDGDTTYTGKVSLYVNGVLKEIINATKSNMKSGWFSTVETLCVGGDRRTKDGDNCSYFRGEIKNVTVYSDLRTASEIAAYASESSYSVDKNDGNLLVGLNLASVNYGQNLKSDGNNLVRDNLEGGMWIEQGVDPYQMPKKFSKAPHTFEATIYVPSTSGRGGVIGGTFLSDDDAACINFEIYDNGVPRLFYRNKNNGTSNILFSDVDVRTGGWVHLALVHEGTRIKCYVNGELMQTISDSKTIEYHSDATKYAMCLGDDWRMGQSFKGKIKGFAMYSDAKTADEIEATYQSGVDTTDKNILAYYEFTGREGAEAIPDLSGKGNTLAKYWINDSGIDTSKYDYTFVVVGDTQKQANTDWKMGSDDNPDNDTKYMDQIYDWIVANKDAQNIKLVLGMGDITNDNTAGEWEIAKSAISKLAAANLPYHIIYGYPHDNLAEFDTYFKNEANFKNADIGYYSGDSLGNYYMRFTINGIKYMIIGIEFGANDKILKWVGEMADANPDYRVIVTTHAYMFRDGTTLDKDDVAPPNRTGKTVDENSRNNGDMMFDKLIKKHRNIHMVMSGHDPYDSIAYRQDRGESGNIISQFLVDPQNMNVAYGMVALFHFSADGKKLAVEWYSTGQGRYYKPSNQFELTVIDNYNLGICSMVLVESESDETKSVYRFFYTNGTYSDFTVTHGKDGQPGNTPYIGNNGNWFIDGIDTEIYASGVQVIPPYIGTNGNWWVNGIDTGMQPQGKKGEPGVTGATGVMGATGAQGEKGDKGDTGANGPMGPQGVSGMSTVITALGSVSAVMGVCSIAMVVFCIVTGKKKKLL